MAKENKRNRKENKPFLVERVFRIRPAVENVRYVTKMKEAYPELAEMKRERFHGVISCKSLNEELIEKMEKLFLPKKELV
jgi:hypothetical protein